MIRRIVNGALGHLTRLVIESADRDIERRIEMMRRGERPSLLARMVEHPVGFCILFFLGIFAALGFAEILCTLAGAPFDPRLG